MKTLFELCEPRPDILTGAVKESEFAADLAQVLRGEGPAEYLDPAVFFANTHPTDGLKRLLDNVCRRLSGTGGEASSIFRLDTQYGGGKTHALIALSHLARGAAGVPNIPEFLSPGLLPRSVVRVAAFDGENADPVNGRRMGAGVRAYTPWGELAYALNGIEGYESVRRSDEERIAPGADTLRALFGGQPTVVLLDELSVYLRKVHGRDEARQLTPFLTGLFKAIESSPGAALVFTLAIGKAGVASDAYADENEALASRLAEAESVAARKATLLDPTSEHETVQVLRRRIFQRIDDAGAAAVVGAYRELWTRYAADLPVQRVHEDRAAVFLDGYPFHPALMNVLTDKLATLANFQRVRGMLRLLTQAVALLWQRRPADAHAIHVHHLDPGHGPILNELVTRLELSAYDPAIRNDVSSEDGTSLAADLDARHYAGLPPVTSAVARTILWNSFALNPALQGTNAEELRFATLSPGVDLGFVNDARQRFVAESAYLDDRPMAPLRFLAEANLNLVIRRQEASVDKEDARAELQDRIRTIFSGGTFELVPFAAGPEDVPDDIGNGRPRLVLIGYDADAVRGDRLQIPPLVERIFRTKGTQGDFRQLQNHLVFLVADEQLRDDMKHAMVRRMALRAMRSLTDLPPHQQQKVQELYQKSEQAVAVAIQRCYRHMFFPSRNNRVEGALVELGHTAFDIPSTADQPGKGQQQVERALSDNNKLLRDTDHPLAPSYVRDQTPLRKGQITTAMLRNEFRKDPRLPMLLGDGNFIALVRKGIDEDVYVYRAGDLLLGKGDPWADIRIDDNAFVFTSAYARQQGLWPRKAPTVSDPPQPGGGGGPGTSPQPPDPPATITPPGVEHFAAEAPLKEALMRIWEQARGKRVARLKTLWLRVFDTADAFKLLSACKQVPNAERHLELTAAYETSSGSSLDLEFKGSLEDGEVLREFLEAQFRAAGETDLQTRYTFTFTGGLDLTSDAPEKITERLARFASGAAYVSAEAEAQEA
ncbi:MAG: ATP-binding protein [Acidobacteria bacterium]|nr:ATP-binding protein [Acidobacteriota bacterium]